MLTLTFSNAVIRNLRVTIVDADRSTTSLAYVQAIGSAPGVSVAERSADMTGAMRAIRSGDAIAAIYIPENFEHDLLASANAVGRTLMTHGKPKVSEVYQPGPDLCCVKRAPSPDHKGSCATKVT